MQGWNTLKQGRLRAASAALLALAVALCLMTCGCTAGSEDETEQRTPSEDHPSAYTEETSASTADSEDETQHHAEEPAPDTAKSEDEPQKKTLSASQLPAYTGKPATVIDGNQPHFSSKERALPHGTERYGSLDSLGRCTVAFAVVGPETTPAEDREYIGDVRPAGWHLVSYSFIEGRYLYNRCHLLGFQLTAENANERNLITGTRYLNVQGMLPYENQVADYVQETGNHVLMRVTPLFRGSNLIPSGVQMEAESVEDAGAGVRFNVYCHNVQPGIHIEYDDGSNWPDEEGAKMQAAAEAAANDSDKGNAGTSSNKGSSEISKKPRGGVTFVLNINTERFHKPGCRSVSTMAPHNTRYFYGTRDRAIELGFKPCGNCHP